MVPHTCRFSSGNFHSRGLEGGERWWVGKEGENEAQLKAGALLPLSGSPKECGEKSLGASLPSIAPSFSVTSLHCQRPTSRSLPPPNTRCHHGKDKGSFASPSPQTPFCPGSDHVLCAFEVGALLFPAPHCPLTSPPLEQPFRALEERGLVSRSADHRQGAVGNKNGERFPGQKREKPSATPSFFCLAHEEIDCQPLLGHWVLAWNP